MSMVEGFSRLPAQLLEGSERRKAAQEPDFRFQVRKRDLLPFLLLALVAVTILFWRLGEGSLGDYDEADYAQSAREMLWWNDLNTPRWNGMEFFDKPPLCLWLTALAYKFFGVNEFSARFVSASAGVLVILLVYILGIELFGSRSVGLGAAIILLTVSPNLSSHGYNFVSLARMGQLDMMLILMMTLSVWLVWRGQRDPKSLVLLGLSLGLGLMVKSIAGFMAYGIAALFLLASPRRSWWRKEILWGLLLSALVAAPWHVGQLVIWGRHFWDSYMVSLTMGYVTGDQGHTKDALFYLRSIRRGFPVLYPLVALAVLYGIFRVLLLACPKVSRRRWRRRPKTLRHTSPNRRRDAVRPCSTGAVPAPTVGADLGVCPLPSSALDGGHQRQPEAKAVLLLLCWTVVPFALYNISRSKIGWYMIPIYPALALLTMNLLRSVAFVLTKAGVGRLRPGSGQDWRLAVSSRWSNGLAVLIVLLATLVFNPWLPTAKDFNPGVKAVASYSRYILDADDVLVNYWPGSYWIRPSALFYADRPMLLVTEEGALRRLFTTQEDLYVLTDWIYWEPLQELGSVLYRYSLAEGDGSGGYVLVSSRSQGSQ